jgi:hypothetical protein
MQRELSDLLEAARSEGPPAGITVDDAVAAGRRLQGRRRAAWAGAATFVAVAAIAVAAVAAVPRGSTPRPVAPPAASPVRPAQFSYPTDPWAVSLKGFRLGKLIVSTPIQITPGYQVAYVAKAGSTGGDTQSLSDAVITVYKLGVFDPRLFRSGEATQVNGRPGIYLVPGISNDPGQHLPPTPAIAWQYADNGWAVLSLATPRALTKEQMIAVAAKLTAGRPAVARVATKLSYLPPGYRALQAGLAADPLGPDPSKSFLRLVNGPESYTRLAEPISAYTYIDRPQQQILIAVFPYDFGNYHTPSGTSVTSGTFCPEEHLCYRNIQNGKYQIEVNGINGVQADIGPPRSELEKLINGITVANIDDRSTYFPVTSAVPAGHR